MTSAPTASDVDVAAARLAGVAHRTPVLTSTRLDALAGATIFLKAENLQRSGSFKFRGAYNALAALPAEQRRRGVVAYSSGNHAQALALAARLLAIPATIVMPTDAPAIKLDATRGYGAEVVPYDRYSENREEIGRGLAADRGLELIPPFDHPMVIAGQGTAAHELLTEVPMLDAIVTPLGGGGLLAGTVLAASSLSPATRLVGAEPETGDDAKQSLERGRIVRIGTPRTLADGAQTQSLGELTFPLLRDHVQEVVTVTDDQLVETMALLAGTLKLVVEPTGCLALAAVLAHRDRVQGSRIGVVLSGGNIDLRRYAELLSRVA